MKTFTTTERDPEPSGVGCLSRGGFRFRIFASVLSVVLLGLLAGPRLGATADRTQVPSSAGDEIAREQTRVVIETDRDHYGAGETVVVYISNYLDTAITTVDQRSFCTIVALEHRPETGADWREIRNCISGAPASEVTLEPGSKTQVRLELAQDPFGGIAPGWYRAAIAYSYGTRFSLTPADSHTARSDPFHVDH